jgi:hypothetical protein
MELVVATRVYIDGFNLYYGIVRKRSLHWLDLELFSERLNLGQPVEKIIYCTAMVSGTRDDPHKPDRQYAYLEALRLACQSVEIVLGSFTKHAKLQPLAGCDNAPTCAIEVWVRNEKGSDVNLATRLVHDAHAGRFDKAIVVSGDSDLVEPVRVVVREIGKTVWVRNPYWRDSKELQAVASDYRTIRPSVLATCQFPDPVTDGVKIITKPLAWSTPKPMLTKKQIYLGACPQKGCLNKISVFRYE